MEADAALLGRVEATPKEEAALGSCRDLPLPGRLPIRGAAHPPGRALTGRRGEAEAAFAEEKPAVSAESAKPKKAAAPPAAPPTKPMSWSCILIVSIAILRHMRRCGQLCAALCTAGVLAVDKALGAEPSTGGCSDLERSRRAAGKIISLWFWETVILNISGIIFTPKFSAEDNHDDLTHGRNS